jgi:hypothetical protein
MRIWIAFLIAAMLTADAAAQTVFNNPGFSWNPNSPRGRRQARIYPPLAKSPGDLGETFEAERWGTLSRPWRAPKWGTIGEFGWNGGIGTPSWRLHRY